MPNIAKQLAHVKERIDVACKVSHRKPSTVKLIAVSKTHPVEMIQEAFEDGQYSFGENYVQEAIDKIEALHHLRPKIVWHFIGPLQSNKTRLVAENFDWVHSVDRLKIAQRLSEQRPRDLPNLNILLQINISGEDSKSGVLPNEALSVCIDLAELPNLHLRGLMAIPEPGDSKKSLIALQKLFLQVQSELKKHHYKASFDTLSMGMSDDLEDAVAAGSTMLRIGTAIFGARNYSNDTINNDEH